MENTDYELMKTKALEQMLSGKSCQVSRCQATTKLFAPLLKQFLENALESEMEEHLEKHGKVKKNKRNGKGKKTVKSNIGEVTIQLPQDRNSTFEPRLIKKRERVLADTLAPRYCRFTVWA